MKSRPPGLVMISLLHIFAPFFNMLFSWLILGITPKVLFHGLWQQGAFSFFEFFGMLPLAGWAIYKVKSWSFPVVLVILTWIMFQNLLVMNQYYSLALITLFWFGFFANLACVGYLLRSAVSRALFDPKLRWWESQERFPVTFEVSIHALEEAVGIPKSAIVADFSLGGIFILSEAQINPQQILDFEFTFFQMHFKLKGKVVHQRKLTKGFGYGVCWEDLSFSTRYQLKSIVIGLKQNGLLPKVFPPQKLFADFLYEMKGIRSELVQLIKRAA